MTEVRPEPGREEAPPTPWSFYFLVGLTALYLGYRAVQGIMWLVDRLGG